MTILERFDEDFKTALKAREEVRISTIRMARTALKNKEIDLRHPLEENEVHAVLKTMIKQYQDALLDFQGAGRQDLIERQEQEIDILSAYLPPSLPREELERIVAEAVRSSGVSEVGRAMGAAMKAVAGRADGSEVRAIVETLLKSSK